MLDEIFKAALAALDLTEAEAAKVVEALRKERASTDARACAINAWYHPDGSTTRLEDAVPRANRAYSKSREKATKAALAFVEAQLAAKVARERCDDAGKMLTLKRQEGSAIGADGVKADVREWYERLELHGVRPSYLDDFSNENIAIIADLIRWKAKDARFRDPENPWRQLLGIYANRVIKKPDGKSKATLSKPGTPTVQRHIGAEGRSRNLSLNM